MKKIVCDLAKNKCIPCQGGVPAMKKSEIQANLKKLGNKWSLTKSGHLYCQYDFSDFMKAMKFANDIAKIAEEEGHHPDLCIAWGKCTCEIWTHKINGLSKSDFYLAAKIELLDKG